VSQSYLCRQVIPSNVMV